MTQLEFLDFFIENSIYYLICLIVIFIFLGLYLRRNKIWIFDPMGFSLISAALADVIPLVLLIGGKISFEIFCYFVIFELLFFGGLSMFSRNWTISPINFRINNSDRISFFVIFFLYIILYIVKFKYIGIPLLMEESRLSLFQNSGGLGIISRITPFCNIYSILFCFYEIRRKKNKYYYILSILIICNLLDGSKGFIVIFIICYSFLFAKKINLRKILLIAPFILVGGFINQLITFNGDMESALFSTGGRLISNGDVYYTVLPYDTYTKFNIDNPPLFLFQQAFAPLRLASYPENIGYKIGQSLKNTGDSTGPNLRPPILFLIMFGKFGAYIGAYLYGIFLSLCIYGVSKMKIKKNFLLSALSLYLYSIICEGITGTLDFLGHFLDILISCMIVILLIIFTRTYNYYDKNLGILSTSVSSNSRK